MRTLLCLSALLAACGRSDAPLSPVGEPGDSDPPPPVVTGSDPPTAETLEDTSPETYVPPTPTVFRLEDPLRDGTAGLAVGGSFGPDGWTVTANADRIIWELPR